MLETFYLGSQYEPLFLLRKTHVLYHTRQVININVLQSLVALELSGLHILI